MKQFDLIPKNMTYIQETLFDGNALKELGQEQVLTNTPSMWKETALDLIQGLALTNEEFSCDDLRALIEPPQNGNSFGAIFASAVKKKIIRGTGKYAPSKIPSNHGHIQKIWTRY